MRFKRLACSLALAAAVVLAAAPLLAQSWPQRTVRLIVPNPAGVGLDVVARLFADRLSQRFGQTIVVENIPGADGTLAAREFATKRDNHTLLYSFGGLITINPLLYAKLPYDPARDLVPIASTSDISLVIAVSANLKVDTFADFLKLARSRSGKVSWAATPGLPYFAFAGLQKRAGVESVHVPYRDFNQALVDLSEGRIDAVATGIAPTLPHAQSGKIKLVALINGTRSPVAPAVPTLVELGYADFSFSAITGFFGWRDMPADLRERIAAEIRAIAADPAIRGRLSKMGAVALGSTPAEFTAAIEQQRVKVAEVARLIKLKP